MNKQRRRQVLAVATVYVSITIGSLFFGHSITHAAEAGTARVVYKIITSINKIKNAPPIIVNNSKVINAYSFADKIVITTGMLAYVHNDNELALILGHELAHFVHKDNGSSIPKEYRADKDGAIYMHNAGYNICVGAQALRRLHSDGGNDHPTSEARYHELGCH